MGGVCVPDGVDEDVADRGEEETVAVAGDKDAIGARALLPAGE